MWGFYWGGVQVSLYHSLFIFTILCVLGESSVQDQHIKDITHSKVFTSEWMLPFCPTPCSPDWSYLFSSVSLLVLGPMYEASLNLSGNVLSPWPQACQISPTLCFHTEAHLWRQVLQLVLDCDLSFLWTSKTFKVFTTCVMSCKALHPSLTLSSHSLPSHWVHELL